jgi:hypothetical protein
MAGVTPSSAVGAYGLRLEGFAPVLLNAGPPDGWPPVRLVQQSGSAYDDVTVGPESARFTLRRDGAVVADRATRTVTVSTLQPVSDDELVHPYLAWVASAFARWDGREAYHGGGVVLNGGAWGVTGDRGTGKSTLLAYGASVGRPVLSDDLLVLDRGAALAGPRCVDLRSGAAAELGLGREVSTERRERHRVELPAVALEVPFRGWILLAWAERLGIRRVPPGEALVRLGGQRMMQLHEARPEGLLDQATLPVWELARPRDFSHLPRSLALIDDL